MKTNGGLMHNGVEVDVDVLLFQAVSALHQMGLSLQIEQDLREQCRRAIHNKSQKEIGGRLAKFLKDRNHPLGQILADALKARPAKPEKRCFYDPEVPT